MFSIPHQAHAARARALVPLPANVPASPTPAASVEFDNVSFAYGARSILQDVRLRIDPGEMVGLLGPNGAGKSTLLKLAGGVLRARAGRILLGQDDVRQLARSEAARRVAVVPQDFSVHFAYTVRQLVELGRMPHLGVWGVLSGSDQRAVEAALVATDLADLAGRVFNELSGGERQRVLVAMAVAQGSGILLLDEPTAHLDIRHQVEVLELLCRLNRDRGLTVLAALHDLNLAARYFPRLVLFRQGIVADGPPAAVLDTALLSAVYETPVQVGILRGEAHLSVLPPGRGEPRGASPHNAAVHVVAGGGAGELVMRALADAAIPFTAGALNIGDSDYALASLLASRCVAESAYAPISADGLAATQACMAAARAIIVCPTPFGPGNVALLDAALEAAGNGQLVVLVEAPAAAPGGHDEDALLTNVRARDFTGGHASATYAALLAAGAQVAPTPGDVVQAMQDAAPNAFPGHGVGRALAPAEG